MAHGTSTERPIPSVPDAQTGNTGQPTTVQDEAPAAARNQAGPSK
jgi:hypothetical protein